MRQTEEGREEEREIEEEGAVSRRLYVLLLSPLPTFGCLFVLSYSNASFSLLFLHPRSTSFSSSPWHHNNIYFPPFSSEIPLNPVNPFRRFHPLHTRLVLAVLDN